VFSSALTYSISAPPASSLQICKLNDPKRDECIKNSIQSFLPSLRQKPEKIDFPPLEPLKYDRVAFNYKTSDVLSGGFIIRNTKAYGLSYSKIRNLKSNFTENHMKIEIEMGTKEIFITGDYKGNLTFRDINLNSRGKFNVTMIKTVGKMIIKGRLETIDGENYMKVYSFDVFPNPRDMKFSISGLFPDETLSEF
jgi:hypothetical protein